VAAPLHGAISPLPKLKTVAAEALSEAVTNRVITSQNAVFEGAITYSCGTDVLRLIAFQGLGWVATASFTPSSYFLKSESKSI